MAKYVAHDYGFKYITFPDCDVEAERLKMEAWLYKLWNGENPVELLQEEYNNERSNR